MDFKSKLYKPSWSIFFSSSLGIVIFSCVGFLAILHGDDIKSKVIGSGLLLVPIVLLGFLIRFFYYIKSNRGIYWDEEGIVVNFKGTKVPWKEIREIGTVSTPKNGISTVIALKESQKVYEIYWSYVRLAKEMHKELLMCWNRYHNSAMSQIY